jgi:hypothetical protein
MLEDFQEARVTHLQSDLPASQSRAGAEYVLPGPESWKLLNFCKCICINYRPASSRLLTSFEHCDFLENTFLHKRIDGDSARRSAAYDSDAFNEEHLGESRTSLYKRTIQ